MLLVSERVEPETSWAMRLSPGIIDPGPPWMVLLFGIPVCQEAR